MLWAALPPTAVTRIIQIYDEKTTRRPRFMYPRDMRPPQVPIMPFVVLALVLWPGALPPRRLKQLAFAIWLAGGVALCSFGLMRLNEARSSGAGSPRR